MRALFIVCATLMATSGAVAQISVPRTPSTSNFGGGAEQKQDIGTIQPILPPITKDPIVLPDPPSTTKGKLEFGCPPELCKPPTGKNQIN